MGDNTNIEWTDATWNPTTGCDKVSPGCDHCYAMTLAPRLKAMGSAHYQTDGNEKTSGPGFGIAMHPDGLDKPLRWQRPRRIFVNSMSDLFHAGVTDEFIAEVFAVMALAKHHTFQLLTKRHGRMRSLLNSPAWPGLVQNAVARRDATVVVTLPLPNVWIGVSVEDQQRADLRIPALLDTPAAVRFLSMEPLLGPVDMSVWLLEGVTQRTDYGTGLEHDVAPSYELGWVIVGGESGAGARPMHPDWVRSLRDQCNAGDVPFHFKQWGSWSPVEDEPAHGDCWVLGRGYASMESGDGRGIIGTMPMQRWEPGSVGAAPGKWHTFGDVLVRPTPKKAAGRELDGRTWDEWPSEDRA